MFQWEVSVTESAHLVVAVAWVGLILNDHVATLIHPSVRREDGISDLFPYQLRLHLQRSLKVDHLKGCQRGQYQQMLTPHRPQRNTALRL